MRILAVDTSGEQGSVAVVAGGEALGEVRLRPPVGHSLTLLPAVEFLLRALGLAPLDIEGYAIALGPGSFTGVRVGLSTVQGLALASGRPCLGLSNLDVLAARIAGEADCLAAIVDAYRDEVWTRRYDRAAQPTGPALRQSPADALAGLPASCAVVGSGTMRYAALLAERAPHARLPARSPHLARTLGILAEPRLAAGEGVAPGELRPVYLRDADARVSPAR
ncbi:MAG: tRNA (adenosine(37)-N6)-threonylcarbamoyltransferase complex dimerization subunit type 1 TsaB [Vicinamibacteria bacterium]